MSNDSTQADTLVEVQQEQVTHLYEKTGLSFWGNAVIATVLTILLSFQYVGDVNHLHLFIWFGLILASSVYRLVVANNFRKERSLTPDKVNYWASKYIKISTAINIVWGSIGVFLFPESTLHQSLLVLSLLSVLLASVPLLAISKSLYYVQMAIVLLPITIFLIYKGGERNLMAAALVTAAVILVFASNYIYDLLFQLQKTQAELLRQANTDQLTKIPNRRHYDQAFKTEWRRCTREHLPISMLLIDVDYFKKYNDKLGHVEGDECLKQVASRLGNISRRPGDVAARYGGEEFSVLLPNTSEENAIMLAERFRVSIERLGIKHPDSEFDVVTVSIGVSSCDPTLHESDDVTYPAMLMNSADNAMYLAKRQGRNRIATQGCGEQKIADALREEALKDANRAKPESTKELEESESSTEPA